MIIKINDVLQYKWKSIYMKILISNFFTNKNLKKAIVEKWSKSNSKSYKKEAKLQPLLHFFVIAFLRFLLVKKLEIKIFM